jgi:hypothetical protein
VPELQESELLNMSKVIVPVIALWAIAVPLLEFVKTPLWGQPMLRTFYVAWHNVCMSGLESTSYPWTWLVWQPSSNLPETMGDVHYQSMSSSISILIIPAIFYLIWQTIKDGNKYSIAMFALCWLLASYGSFILLYLIADRPMYLFHFYPSIPVVCLIIALGIWKLFSALSRRSITKVPLFSLATLLLLHLANFILTFVV